MIEPPHVIISDQVMNEYRWKRDKLSTFGGFMATLFQEFWDRVGHDRHYVILKETDYKKLLEAASRKER